MKAFVERRAGRYLIRLADPTDAADLAPRLRPWDMVECFAAGHDPRAALMAPFLDGNGPETWAIEENGTLIAMFGLTPSPGGTSAAVWLLGAEALEGGGLALLAGGREWLAEALRLYPRLWNVVPARCEATIRWLRWLGFDIGTEFLHLRSIRFLRFRMDRKDGPNSAPAPAGEHPL